MDDLLEDIRTWSKSNKDELPEDDLHEILNEREEEEDD